MTKRNLFITLLLVVLASPLLVNSAEQIRAKPLLRHDKEYNAILLHVAQYFVLTIPDGKTVNDISHNILCTFVIKPNGALRELLIENTTSGVAGIFEGASSKRTEMWLRDAVLKGMGYVPSFDMSKIRSSKSDKKRTIVFSFGRRGGQPTNTTSMGFNTDALRANLTQVIQQYQKDIREGKSFGETPGYGMTSEETRRRYLHQQEPWSEFTADNIKSTMKPTYEPHRQSMPVIKSPLNLPMSGDSLPRIEVAISLQ